MKKIKLMTDYYCYPLWWAAGSGNAGDIDPKTLPLKSETIKRIEAWAAIFHSILNKEDPAASGFASEEDMKAFDREGISIWHQLRSELEPEYEVHYFSQWLGEHLTHPKQLELDSELTVTR